LTTNRPSNASVLPSSGTALFLPAALVCQPSRFLPLNSSLKPGSGLNSSAATVTAQVAANSTQERRRMGDLGGK
jgi:hypothetical protein